MSFNFFDLKSGTDVRGVAYAPENEITLTDERVDLIVKAFSERFDFSKQITIAVGHDSRLSANRIKNAVAKGLKEVGVRVLDVGLASTPAMFMTTKLGKEQVDGAIMITASHLPQDKNGLKFFEGTGGLESKDIEVMLKRAIADTPFTLREGGSVEAYDFMPVYSKHLEDMVKKSCNKELPLKGMKIVVDAGNGAGGFYEKILKNLGANTDGSQFLEPDGSFPNHIPNPENVVAMQAISDCVVKNKADLGIIFDTDVDRAAIVSKEGKEINRNRLIALISAVLLGESKEGTIVTDSITSVGLKDFISSLGGKHFRFKRGYKNVINKSKELNALGEYSPLAIETSGHAALKENYFLDDGAYLITRLVIAAAKLKEEGKDLTDLINTLKDPYEAVEVRMGFKVADFKEYGLSVLKAFEEYVKGCSFASLEEPNYEGVRVNFNKENGNGWLLLRMSLHDPIMPLNIESDEEGGNKIIAKLLYDFLKDFEKLELKNLEKFINE